MPSVQFSAHAVLRYAERALGFPVEKERNLLAQNTGSSINDVQLLDHLESSRKLDATRIRDFMDSPAVRTMTKLGTGNVITPLGRIVIKDGVVVTFLERTMKRQNQTPRRDGIVWIRGERRSANL